MTRAIKATSLPVQEAQELLEKGAIMFAQIYPDRFPGRWFACGEGGEKDENGLPERIHVCPAYGAGFSVIYERKSVSQTETHDIPLRERTQSE